MFTSLYLRAEIHRERKRFHQLPSVWRSGHKMAVLAHLMDQTWKTDSYTLHFYHKHSLCNYFNAKDQMKVGRPLHGCNTKKSILSHTPGQL